MSTKLDVFGKIAVTAAEDASRGKSPREAWALAAECVAPNSKSMQKKGCPRDTFLGLCSHGLIRGVPAKNYTRSIKNTSYGLEAVKILKTDSSFLIDRRALWRAVIGEEKKEENGQMSVVIALFGRNFIR